MHIKSIKLWYAIESKILKKKSWREGSVTGATKVSSINEKRLAILKWRNWYILLESISESVLCTEFCNCCTQQLKSKKQSFYRHAVLIASYSQWRITRSVNTGNQILKRSSRGRGSCERRFIPAVYFITLARLVRIHMLWN